MSIYPSSSDFYRGPKFSEQLEKLEREFMEVINTDVPFFAIEDQLLFLMNERNIDHFRIPGNRCVDGKDHIFYFRVGGIKGFPALKQYEYLYQKAVN